MFRARASIGARNGVLKANGVEIPTPNFIVSTTRGAVPHLTPDHSPSMPVANVYLEELYDREGPLLHCAQREALPLKSQFLLCSARRPDSRTISSKPNTDTSLGIDTIQGSKMASISDLTKFVTGFSPDICLVPYDIPAQSQEGKVGNNRLHKMERRSVEWLKQFKEARDQCKGNWLLVAHIPNVLYTQQYLDQIDPLCDAYCLDNTGRTGASQLVTENSKLRLSNATNPKWIDVLQDINSGSDIVHIPLTTYAEAGRALSITLDSTTPEYMDLNSEQYRTDMTELGSTGHSLAYINHLLNAEEMTAQVLLQMHNFAVVTKLFEDTRAAIEDGSFGEKMQKFAAVYQ